jgi:hypothetical protein
MLANTSLAKGLGWNSVFRVFTIFRGYFYLLSQRGLKAKPGAGVAGSWFLRRLI